MSHSFIILPRNKRSSIFIYLFIYNLKISTSLQNYTVRFQFYGNFNTFDLLHASPCRNREVDKGGKYSFRKYKFLRARFFLYFVIWMKLFPHQAYFVIKI